MPFPEPCGRSREGAVEASAGVHVCRAIEHRKCCSSECRGRQFVGWSGSSSLEQAGREYYEFRATLMKRRHEGLTKIYNRFHDRYEFARDIVQLRELHSKMDQAVLAEYGWDGIQAKSEFLPDYDTEKPLAKRFWRYRWPNEVRDQVLGQLIELNARRKREEQEKSKIGGVKTRIGMKLPPKSPLEEQPDESPFLVPPPLFADQSD